MQFLPQEVGPELQRKWKDAEGSEAKWDIWLELYGKCKSGNVKTFDPLCLEALVLSYLYPRIDAAVSTGINHLLKAPFCVHPKTGNVCVPFDPLKLTEFKLAEVPT